MGWWWMMCIIWEFFLLIDVPYQWICVLGFDHVLNSIPWKEGDLFQTWSEPISSQRNIYMRLEPLEQNMQLKQLSCSSELGGYELITKKWLFSDSGRFKTSKFLRLASIRVGEVNYYIKFTQVYVLHLKFAEFSIIKIPGAQCMAYLFTCMSLIF